MVSIAAFQAVDPGSIPGPRIFWKNFSWKINSKLNKIKLTKKL